MKYWENKSILKKNFELASKFIDNLENSERIQKGYSIGISTNLHFYLGNWFLFRIEFVGYDAIKFIYTPRKVPNREIKSKDFLMVLRKVVGNSNMKHKSEFYNDSIIIRKVNSYYLELVDQTIEKFYEHLVRQAQKQESNDEIHETELEENVANETMENEFDNQIEQKTLSFRKSSGIDISYFRINREERNLCAILFHTLLIENNFKLFLNKINCDFPVVENEKSIYLEYAFIRDIWENIRDKNGINEGNKIKKKIILDFLNLSNRSELEKMSISSFNDFFVQSKTRKPSSTEIESPGNWSVAKFNENVSDNTEFLNICKFKWSFNAKPDIVINTSNNQAICIEGKFKSGEGNYPANNSEKEIFHRRNIPFVGQLEMQPEIMKILDIESKFVLLANSKIYSKSHDSYTWKEIFYALDISRCQAFVKEWINRDDIN